MRRKREQGMTLVEITVALGIAGLVVLTAATLLRSATDLTERIVTDGAMTTREGNGGRILRNVFGNAFLDADSSGFHGDADRVEFTTWCPVPSGWSKACHVVVSIDRYADSSVIFAAFHDVDYLPLRTTRRGATLSYCDAARRDSAWISKWDAKATMPIAAAVVAGDDTLVFPIGVARD